MAPLCHLRPLHQLIIIVLILTMVAEPAGRVKVRSVASRSAGDFLLYERDK